MPILEGKNQEDEDRLNKIRQQTIATVKQNRESSVAIDNSEFILLRTRQIRPEFLSTLKAANQQILIHSPWVTEEVVDEDLMVVHSDGRGWGR